MNLDAKKFAEQCNAQSNQPEAPAQPIQWADLLAWDNIPVPEREWLIKDCIPIRQPTLLSGEGAVGKSLLTLHLLVATALGRDWIGKMPEQGAAWYLGAEDEERELHIRLNGIRLHYNASFAELADGGFRMKSLFNENALLGVPNRSGMIEPTALYHRLYEEAADLKPRVVALDASADVYAGNEIDRSQVRQFVGLLRKLAGACNGAVILLAHPSLSGINSGSGISGSTAWHNSMRARIYLKSPQPEAGEQPDSDLRELTFKKNNYGPKNDSIILRYKNGLFLPEAGMSSLDKAEREMNVDTAFLAGLQKLIDQGQSVSPQVQSHTYAPRMIAKVEKEYRPKELEAAQGRLLDARRIHVRNEGRPSHPVRRLYPGAPPDCDGGLRGEGGAHAQPQRAAH
jgi:RecA-family ATPase